MIFPLILILSIGCSNTRKERIPPPVHTDVEREFENWRNLKPSSAIAPNPMETVEKKNSPPPSLPSPPLALLVALSPITQKSARPATNQNRNRSKYRMVLYQTPQKPSSLPAAHRTHPQSMHSEKWQQTQPKSSSLYQKEAENSQIVKC